MPAGEMLQAPRQQRQQQGQAQQGRRGPSRERAQQAPARALPAEIETYDDHRMAMSFALAGLKACGVVIKDPGCVNKTFPEFFDVLKSLTPS